MAMCGVDIPRIADELLEGGTPPLVGTTLFTYFVTLPTLIGGVTGGPLIARFRVGGTVLVVAVTNRS